jgi:hypothetical protein
MGCLEGGLCRKIGWLVFEGIIGALVFSDWMVRFSKDWRDFQRIGAVFKGLVFRGFGFLLPYTN